MGISSAVNRAQIYSSRSNSPVIQRHQVELESRRQQKDKQFAQQSKALGRELTDFISKTAQDYTITRYA